jgi:hypothetical protein
LHGRGDSRDPLRTILDAATGTAADAAPPLAVIDDLTRDPWRLFARWDEIRPRLQGLIADLDWYLDGWPQILQALADAACVPAEDRRTTLAKLAQIAARPALQQ